MEKESVKYARQREEMVRNQLEARGIKAPKVLAAFRKVPRHLFVSEALRDQAYVIILCRSENSKQFLSHLLWLR